MAFNVVCSMILVLLGSPLRIYIISNGGYLLSCSLALPRLLRRTGSCARTCRGRSGCRPSPKWIALAVFIVWTVIYFFGGWNSPKIVWPTRTRAPGSTCSGLLIVALYAPLYWWRRCAGPQARRRRCPGRGGRGAAAPMAGGRWRRARRRKWPPLRRCQPGRPGGRFRGARASRRPSGSRSRGTCCSRARRFDPQPTAPAAVLLASSGRAVQPGGGASRARAAAGEPVAVLSILKIYGSTFGLPNPGLLPTRREREEQFAIVSRAINRSWSGSGCTAGRPDRRHPQRRPDDRPGGPGPAGPGTWSWTTPPRAACAG